MHVGFSPDMSQQSVTPDGVIHIETHSLEPLGWMESADFAVHFRVRLIQSDLCLELLHFITWSCLYLVLTTWGNHCLRAAKDISSMSRRMGVAQNMHHLSRRMVVQRRTWRKAIVGLAGLSTDALGLAV